MISVLFVEQMPRVLRVAMLVACEQLLNSVSVISISMQVQV